MSEENFKLLIRNLRTGKNAKLKIQTTATAIRYKQTGKSVQLRSRKESDNSK